MFFSVLLHDNTVDIEKHDKICLPISFVDRFLGLFLHQPFLLDI